MKLFNEAVESTRNLLPHDGIVNYYGTIMPAKEAEKYLQSMLRSIEWRNDEAVLFGRRIITKRKVAWYGDSPFEYRYSNTTKKALPWTKDLVTLKKLVEELSGEVYNSCLLNLYHSGEEGMAWHSDDETKLLKDGAIGSLSFGAERRFLFRHRRGRETIEIMLEQGSLLVMKGETQTHWMHRLPPTTKVKTPRINLTFRTIVP